jgi:putative flippase GtrA
MNTSMAAASRHEFGEIARYVANGLAATAVHFAVLVLGLKVLLIPSAGLANLVAAVFGISVSFLGGRYFVFRRRDQPMGAQAARFALLYVFMALVHGLVLAVWTDWWALDYRWGFVLATGMQVAASYWGNKRLVFGRSAPGGNH